MDKNLSRLSLLNLNESSILIEGSIKDSSLLEEIFQKYPIEHVIHLVSGMLPNSSGESFLLEMDEVVLPTFKLIELMKKCEVSNLIYLSSGGTVYGNYKQSGTYNEDDSLKPINYYGLSKAHIEEFIKFAGRNNFINYLIIRPSNPFGDFQNLHGSQGLISKIFGNYLAGKPLEIWGDGSTIRDYMPIKYLCKSIIELSALNLKNEVINIGSGQGYSVNEIIELSEQILNKKLPIIYKPARSIDSGKVVLNIEKLNTLLDHKSINLKSCISEYYLTLHNIYR